MSIVEKFKLSSSIYGTEDIKVQKECTFAKVILTYHLISIFPSIHVLAVKFKISFELRVLQLSNM